MKKNVTITQIAEYLNISPATVSRALNHRSLVNPETLEKIDAAMQSLGYHSSRPSNHRQNRQKIILLNIPDINNAFYQEIIKGAGSSASAHKYTLLINEGPLSQSTIQDYCNILTDINASGTILLNRLPEEDLQAIHAICPLVQCSEYNEESEFPYVSINNYSAAKTAVEYLLSCGCNKISLLNGPRNFRYSSERLHGFIDAITQAEVFIPKKWIIHLPEVNFNIAYAAVCKLLNADVRPDAFFAVSDIFAAAAIRGLHRYNLRIPDDVMVIGFDNIPISMMTSPSITTISQPTISQGYAACESLIDMIENPGVVSQSLILETELIVRESTSSRLNLQRHRKYTDA